MFVPTLLLCRNDTIPTLLSCLHSLYWSDTTHPYIYFIFIKHFLFTCFLIYLNTSVLIANRKSYSMLEGSEVPCLTSSQKSVLTYCDEEIVIIKTTVISRNLLGLGMVPSIRRFFWIQQESCNDTSCFTHWVIVVHERRRNMEQFSIFINLYCDV